MSKKAAVDEYTEHWAWSAWASWRGDLRLLAHIARVAREAVEEIAEFTPARRALRLIGRSGLLSAASGLLLALIRVKSGTG